jgi:hypothetical protein
MIGEISPSRRPCWHVAILVFVLLLAAIGFTAHNLEISKRIGRLSGVPNYDDVVYLNSASKIYYLGKTAGLPAAAAAALGTELHAPFPVLNGLAGFIIFGPDVDHIYEMLAVVVLTYLLFAAAVTRGPPFLLWLGLALFSLTVPFATMCAVEFRPDLMWATVLCGSSVLFLTAERPFSSWKPSILYGFAIGAALLIKPSTFAMTLLVTGGVWFLVALTAMLDKSTGSSSIAKGFGLTILGTVLISGWYCVPHAGEIFGYFYVNSFGENKDVWIYKGDLFSRISYYVSGIPLQSNLGKLFLPFLAIYLGGAGRDIFASGTLRSRLRGAAFLWMLGCLFAVNAYFSMKSPFLGGAFYGFLIFGALWYLAQFFQSALLRRWCPPIPYQIGICVILWGLGAASYAFPYVSVMNPERTQVEAYVNRALLSDLLARITTRRSVILVTQGNPVVGEYLQMEFRERGKDLRITNTAMERTVQKVVDLSKRRRYAVVQDQNMTGAPLDAIPGEKLQPELITYFSQSPNWRLIAKYPDRKGHNVYLYEHLNRL